MNFCIPIVSGRTASSVASVKAKIKSPQANKKLNVQIVRIIGFVSGRIILTKAVNVLQPSMTAASSNPFGIARKKMAA